MQQETIEVGHKASPFAKGLFVSAVQALAITIQDASTNHWNSKKVYELTQCDITYIRDFVKSHYESDIHQLLTHGGKPVPKNYAQFATLQLGNCQMLPDSYYTEAKKLHGYYEAFGLEGTHLFKKDIQSWYGKSVVYDRVIREIGLETAAATGAEHMLYLTHLLKECKNPPKKEEQVSLVPYYQDIIKFLKTQHSSGKPMAYVIATLRAILKENKIDGIDMHYLITAFFEQYKSKGLMKLQEFLEAFYNKANSDFVCFMNDFKAAPNEKYPDSAKGKNQRFINQLVSIDNFEKLQALYKQSKQDKTLQQRKDLLLEKDGYEEGTAYLNSVPLEMLQHQLENNDLNQHYIAFQNI